MRNGDLSNETVPRIVLVFENALGFLAAEDRRKFDRAIARQHWDNAADLWQINPAMAAQVWHVTRHLSLTLDVVTFEGPREFGVALEEFVQDIQELPVNRVWATRVELLARRIAYMPDLMAVYDPDPKRQLTWGGKGRYITRADQLGA